MIRLRALLLPLLILLLVVTGVGLGMARGAMAADQRLCSVTGPTPIVLAHDGLPLFDADGQPVTLDRDGCLDCLISAIALLPATIGPAAPCAFCTTELAPRSSGWMPTGANPGGLARAPPRAA